MPNGTSIGENDTDTKEKKNVNNEEHPVNEMANDTPYDEATLSSYNSGVYDFDDPPNFVAPNQIVGDVGRLIQTTLNYFWTVCSMFEGNYIVVGTIFMILLLGLLLPDISRKVQVAKEMKDVQRVLDIVSKQVSRAEVACVTAADEISSMKHTVKDDHNEISHEGSDSDRCQCTRTRGPVDYETINCIFKKFKYPHRDISLKEEPIMSYLYTDSFDCKKPANKTNPTVETAPNNKPELI